MLTLPVPPSTNNLFVNVRGRGRRKSDEYRAWLHEAGLKLNLQRPQPVSGPVHVTIRIPDIARGDLDNRIKASLDLLVKHRLIEDDSMVASIHVSRYGGAEMQVEVRPGRAE